MEASERREKSLIQKALGVAAYNHKLYIKSRYRKVVSKQTKRTLDKKASLIVDCRYEQKPGYNVRLKGT